MTEYVLSLSYGKDSIACLEAIKLLGLPLDRIVHAEVWATDTIPADLPPMVEFKAKADKIILERYGIEVEHLCAVRERERECFQKLFYRERRNGQIYGFPHIKGNWCTSDLKTRVLNGIRKGDLRKAVLPYPETENGGGAVRRTVQRLPVTAEPVVQQTQDRVYLRNRLKDPTDFQSARSEGIGVPDSRQGFSDSTLAQGAEINIVQYLGIAADEPERIARHTKPGIVLPLVEIGWDEAYCRQWCEENDLLSPIYTTVTRGGCWFCHNQSVQQLRLLRKNYPDLWALLMKWDTDSPVTFHPDGHTVHDFDLRFSMEDMELIPTDRKFRWAMLTDKRSEWLHKLLED